VPLSTRIVGVGGSAVDGAVLEVMNLDSGALVPLQRFAGGSYETPCVAPGHYRVTARLGTLEASEDVMLEGAADSITLRLPTEAAGAAGAGPAISVADLKVPGKARKALEQAREKLAKHNIADAFRHVEDALKIDSNYSAAYQLRGLLKLTQAHVSDAITDLDHAIKLDSGNAMARIVLGAAYNSSQKFADAARTLEAAVPLAANAWQVHYELGKAYAGLGRLHESLTSLNRALELNPTYPEIRYARAYVFVHAGQYQDAAADLKQYLHDSPNGPEAGQVKQLLAAMPKQDGQ
jgi:predicted Zn-dependent protease